ncbi:MAG: ABC transporter permease [Clostridia bacterium]|nr:ABC transporter permease [Clostridia bacterium]
MALARFVARRLALTVLVLFGVSVITFFLSHVVPVDPVVAVLGEHARPDQIANLRRQWGFDQPLPRQYVLYVEHLFHGDLGVSLRTRRPVLVDLEQYFPATLELALGAMLVALLLGLPAGVLSAVYRDRWPDQVTRVAALAGVSMPVFWLGLLLLGLFYYRLGWLPGPGRLDDLVVPPPRLTGLVTLDSLLAGDWPALGSALAHLVLPALTLGYYTTGVIARQTRASMLEVLGQEYVRTARAKGLGERAVVLVHALRNALIPVLTVTGLSFGSLLGGAVLTETIFSWPGLGWYVTNSMLNVDLPAVMGVTLLAALAYALVNLLVDLGYGLLDPRIRYE